MNKTIFILIVLLVMKAGAQNSGFGFKGSLQAVLQ